MGTSPAEHSRNPWLIPLMLLGVAASLLAAVWLVFQPIRDNRPDANPPLLATARFSREESLKLIELRNRAIGHLENHEFAPADATLSEVIRLMPADPFGPHNLAICRQLAVEALDKHRDQANFAQAASLAIESVELSKVAEPKSFVPWIIAARLAKKDDRTDDALASLREAIRLGPQSIGAAYDLFTLLQLIPGDQPNDERFNLLRRVYEKESNNLFVIKDWLPLLVQRREPEFIDTLKRAQETIKPFFKTIQTNTRNDLNEIIEKALAAASEGNWPIAQRSITMVKNLILAEAARDGRFVMLDSLEYVLPDFGGEFQSRADLPLSLLSPSKPVHFLSPNGVAQWPVANDCRDVAVVDFDLNGRSDLIVLQADQLVAWGRKADELPWSMFAKIETGRSYSGLLAFDFDDDVDQELKSTPALNQPADALKHEFYVRGLCHTADPDVILFGSAGLKLLENKKETKSAARSFVQRTAGTEFDEIRGVIAATVADLDSDGDLDLVVSTASGLRIFSNRGNMTFDDISGHSILPPDGVGVTALSIVDWDKDSDIDVLVATTNGGGWLENIRHGRLRYRNLEEFSALEGATSLKVGDFDGDTSWDVVAAGPQGANVIATHRTPAGLVNVRQTNKLLPNAIRSASVGDFDNDGAPDVIVLNDDGATIFCGDGMCGFAPVPRVADDWLKYLTSLVVNDLDRDGDLDLIAIDANGFAFLSSQCRESDNPDNGWLEIQLVGYQVRPGEQNWDKRTNHINLGGMLEVKAGKRYQAKVVTDLVSHFGLGASRRVDVARILWTNGIPTNIVDPIPGEPICIPQLLLGSCPYLYTWNGERFEFVTDLLWNAPLGLKFAENVIAPWREWEYIKIDGDKLKATDNKYQLRITAELWEAEYFDQFKLFAVDHPAGTDIFTNEKVGPAAIAEPKIHTVRNPRKPFAARDSRGRDVLDQVIARDGRYTKTFDTRLAQGLTEEHFLELDLGKFPEAKNVTLFLTGWMYPGSTSLSVQFSQNPDMPKPRPPALYAPDASGEWHEVRPLMGFPGGKTKTIAVDVSDVFANGDHRLRIVSTMELFWDAAFFTVDDIPVDFVQTELTLVRAELHDRGGVSFHSWPSSGNGPDRFDYTNLVAGERWPAMSGNFTRFGDVLPLLTARDDHVVVTGSGDEIRATFAESTSPLRPGWIRDFILYTVGWDKDADLNTVYGDTVDPMPFEAMTVYAHLDGEPRPQDPAYVQYLRDYQTRQRNPTRFWKSVQQWERNRP